MFCVARGIEDHHHWVVLELDGALEETPWRVEHKPDGYWLSHPDDLHETTRVYNLGAFPTPESAVNALRRYLPT